ncbi:hypothetical protein L3H50_10080 [Corynebacterium sp. MC-04]|uniref:Secreted protein n=2 Tax=Corynebacterium TaxID=1716 RepID=A0ABS9HIL2_9CORY|nr:MULTISPECIES: hypothetical protein [Corynebacterium]ACR18440.1 putative secreted protein [Corynebacterium kroppenstedtii DSM 44385]KXB50969.1 hypothetical protein HMPREF1861_00748 [Corynebacterium kroppenstedtii]MBY0792437.1 hypothetical protein [Corynebacterium parakroppenstedtii]MBY0793916.1 hypothetical protein [Corynebacterium parakroppenstedtii]MBY0795807.1 hypothetical protein [Corynebacterium parakroppenstedtii]
MGEKLRQFFGVPSLSAFFTIIIGCVAVAVFMTTAMADQSPVLRVIVFVALIFVIRGVGALVRYFQKNREQR